MLEEHFDREVLDQVCEHDRGYWGKPEVLEGPSAGARNLPYSTRIGQPLDAKLSELPQSAQSEKSRPEGYANEPNASAHHRRYD
jgi:hypothetical protein